MLIDASIAHFCKNRYSGQPIPQALSQRPGEAHLKTYMKIMDINLRFHCANSATIKIHANNTISDEHLFASANRYN